MVGTEVPRGVRVAALAAWLMVPAGLLLIVAGVLELRWWGSSDATRLLAVLAGLQDEFGTLPPALLSGRGGAVTFIVLGAVCLAFAVLAPLIGRGRRWARTAGLALGFVTFLIGLFGIGADSTEPHDLNSLYAALNGSALGDRIPQIEALVYPGWYAWLEDIAQGFQVADSLAVVLTLMWAVIAYADYFVTKRTENAPPDEWDAALTRIRTKTDRPTDAE